MKLVLLIAFLTTSTLSLSKTFDRLSIIDQHKSMPLLTNVKNPSSESNKVLIGQSVAPNVISPEAQRREPSKTEPSVNLRVKLPLDSKKEETIEPKQLKEKFVFGQSDTLANIDKKLSTGNTTDSTREQLEKPKIKRKETDQEELVKEEVMNVNKLVVYSFFGVIGFVAVVGIVLKLSK